MGGPGHHTLWTLHPDRLMVWFPAPSSSSRPLSREHRCQVRAGASPNTREKVKPGRWKPAACPALGPAGEPERDRHMTAQSDTGRVSGLEEESGCGTGGAAQLGGHRAGGRASPTPRPAPWADFLVGREPSWAGATSVEREHTRHSWADGRHGTEHGPRVGQSASFLPAARRCPALPRHRAGALPPVEGCSGVQVPAYCTTVVPGSQRRGLWLPRDRGRCRQRAGGWVDGQVER